MATTPELHEPEIAATRAQTWHQAGDALLTLEDARTWLETFGLVLFAPRPALGAPAPSLVEATLGTAKEAATAADMGTARTLAARLTGEGSAVPLNLLGGPGDLPDFLVSAQAFPFVFTLRGDKGWKRPPETTGTVKVSPLALRVFEVLTERGALSVAALVPEVGREVTESAVSRALSELWQMMRVQPLLGEGAGETRWELTTARFLKAVKSGANAGQPTALSALISLYLAQSLVASEEEIAGFLSPLTARSRVRDVLHGLAAGRQLGEGVVDGKTVLYLPEALESLQGSPEAEPGEAQADAGNGVIAGVESGGEAAGERIRQFRGAAAAAGARSLRGKPATGAGRGPDREISPRREGFSRKPRTGGDRGGEEGERRPFPPRAPRTPRSGTSPGQPRREPTGDRPAFNRPWEEERTSRTPRTMGGGDRPFRPQSGAAEGGDRPFRDKGSDRRPPRRDDRGSVGGDRPAYGRRDAGAPGGSRGGAPRAGQPFRPRAEGGAQRPFRPRPDAAGDRPFRPKTPRTDAGDRPFRARPGGGGQPYRPRPEGGNDRPYRPRQEGGNDRPYRPRQEGGAARPYRPRPEGGSDRPFRVRPEGSADRPYRPRPEGGSDRPFRSRPEGGGADRPYRSSRPEGGRGAPPFRAREGGGGEAGRPARRPPFPGRPVQGSDRREARPAGGGFGARPGPREGAPGNSFPGKKLFRKSTGAGGASGRSARPPRKPRIGEDEA